MDSRRSGCRRCEKVWASTDAQCSGGERGGWNISSRAPFGKRPEPDSCLWPAKELCLGRCAKPLGSIAAIACWICSNSFLPSLLVRSLWIAFFEGDRSEEHSLN